MKTQLAIWVSLLVISCDAPTVCLGAEPSEQLTPIPAKRIVIVRVYGPPTRKYEPLMIGEAFGRDRINEIFSFFPELRSLDSAKGIQPVSAAKKNRVVLQSRRNLKDGSYDIDVELYVLEGDSIWTYGGRYFPMKAGWTDFLAKEFARQEKDRESGGVPKLLHVDKHNAEAIGFRVEIGNGLNDEYKQFNVYLKPELAAKFDHTYLAYFREGEFLLGTTAHSRKMDDGQLRSAFNINPKLAADVRFSIRIASKPRPLVYRFELQSFLRIDQPSHQE